MNNSNNNPLFLGGAVIVAGLLIAGAVIWNGSHPASTTGTTGTQGGTPSNVNIKDVKTDGEPYIGNPNAPVTIAEWSDYQCPFCKQWELTTLPQIMQNYVKEGKVKIVFKDFQFLGPNSMVDAEYARAVWHLYPDKFLDWRTKLYSTEAQENSQSASDNLAWLKQTTGSVAGIDLSKVEADVAANKAAYDTQINADKTEAAKFGISATPSFVIGKQMIAGAYPYAPTPGAQYDFQDAINQALSDAGVSVAATATSTQG